MPPKTPTGDLKSPASPFSHRQALGDRRGSITSISSRRLPNSATLPATLDHIHNTASQSNDLTTFAEYAPPPRSAATTQGKGFAGDLVQGGFSGLYSRLRASVGAADQLPTAPGTATPKAVETGGDISAKDMRPEAKHRSTTSVGTSDSIPVTASVTSQQSRSPASARFSEALLKSSKPSTTSITSLVSRTSTADHVSSSTSMPQSKLASSKTLAADEPIPARHVDEVQLGSDVEAARDRRGSDDHDALSAAQTVEHVRGKAVAPSLVVQDGAGSRRLSVPPLGRTISTTATDEDTEDEEPLSSVVPRAVDIDPENTLGGADLVPVETNTTMRNAIREDPTEQEIVARPQRPPLTQVGHSHLPGFRPSRTTSSDGDLSSVTTIAASRHANPVTPAEAGKLRLELQKAAEQDHPKMGSRLLAREFWMRDENAKDCFYCGDTFSTFRRKHHCRTCGQIFDAKCTSILPGKVFGVGNSIRVCKPCEHIINGGDDDSSVFSEESHDMSPSDEKHQITLDTSRGHSIDDLTTPTIGIPVSRKSANETKRRSAVIEFDSQPTLARPSSSRSLRSMSGKPSISRPHTPHNRNKSVLGRAMKSLNGDRAPFQDADSEIERKDTRLPAFHHDNIIDPEIADYLSDEGSSEEEPMSLLAALEGDGNNSPRRDLDGTNFNALFGLRKGKSRFDRSQGASHLGRDSDAVSISSRHGAKHHSRKRNVSVNSMNQVRQSPRRSKSNSLLRNMPLPFGSTLPTQTESDSASLRLPSSSSRVTRSSSMHGESAPSVELNQASLQHVQRMLKQMLQDSHIKKMSRWEKALMPILLKCTNEVNPDVRRRDFIDIRHYVKVKKIPGGGPGDTTYVSGVVFTKNVALKAMPRSIVSPRILIVTFAIEYARHNQHFMSLEPVIAQEKEYLRNIVRRIIMFDPNVLLVQKHVAGFALDLLSEAGVSVVFNVKPSVLNAVGRCTQARLIQTVDKLVFDPSYIGHCGSFDVKTYVSSGTKKTYVWLSGCVPDLGCTITLRGAPKETLRKLKRITEFMCYVVYNLRLETSLMREEYVAIPAAPNDGTMSTQKVQQSEPLKLDETAPALTASAATAIEPQDPNTVLQAVEGSTEPLSEKIAAELATDDDLLDKHITAEKLKESGALPSFYDDVVEKHKTKILSTSPFVKFMPPHLLMQARQMEGRLAELKRLRDQYRTDASEEKSLTASKFQLVKPEMVQAPVPKASRQVKDFLYAVHDAEYDTAMHTYVMQKRQWESYLSGTINLFDPLSHQRIAFLYSMVLTQNTMPCVGPEVIALEFYNEHEMEEGFATDITLGQYVEDLVHGANTVCGVNGCDKTLFDHHRQYVHGLGQMTVFVQKHLPKVPGITKRILMWSQCRICQTETPPIGMSDTTWKYSFGKYLELMFWSSDLRPRAVSCEHDIHRDHVRYFGLQGVAVRMQFDAIDLHEVLIPRSTITWKVNSDLKLKNEQYQKIKERLDRFMLSVKNRLKTIGTSTIVPEKAEECAVELERLTALANSDHEALKEKLQDKYMKSRYYEIVPFNRAMRFMHEKAIEWDDAFAQFERDFFPSEKDISRLAQAQLKRIFMDKDESTTSITDESGTPAETQVESKVGAPDVVHLQPPPSNLSPEDTKHLLEASLEEVTGHGEKQPEPPSTKPPPALSTESSQETDLSKSTSLTKDDAEQLASSQEVKHLDLAIPADHPESPPKTSQLAQPLDAIASGASQASRGDNASAMQATLTKGPSAESGRTSPTLTRDVTHESKIPRPVEQVRPGQNLLVPPPLSRAHSQPADVLRRNQIGHNVGVTAPVKSDLKANLTEAARAFEKRVSERLSRTGRTVSQSLIPRSVTGRGLHVSRLAKHFEQLTKEFEQERVRERKLRSATTKQARAYPLASSRATVEVYPDVYHAMQGRTSPEDTASTTSPERLSTDAKRSFENPQLESVDEDKPSGESSVQEQAQPEPSTAGDADEQATAVADADSQDSDTESHDTLEESLLSPSDSQLDMSMELPKHDKLSLIKMLRAFWSERSASGWTPLEYPLMPNEHVWDNSDVIVREDEPSSIIALALSDGDYLAKLQSFREQRTPMPDAGEKGRADYVEHADHLSLEDERSIEKNLLRPERTHISYSFQHRGVRARCKIFYAESFDALRRKCGVADRFVESLSRCLKYDAKGGKTKSLFLKTLDDRFVLKSLSPPEYNAFFNFAPNYFSFTHQILFRGLPSVIAKMLGLFQVTIKNTVTGFEFDWYMLVMENLFYLQEPDRRFDLKGSMRNRKIQVTGERDEVLQDENLVDIIFEKPIFVREHTMTLLQACVWNDTLFLSQQNVMDYSLMAGFLDTRKEIVVGIIDCIRTYTWDKKLETWIKDRGKNKPTITSPKDYKNRFRIAMSKYILLAPNCWHHFGTQIQKRPLRLSADGHQPEETEAHVPVAGADTAAA